KDVDVALFAHVGANMNVSWGDSSSNGLVSVEYTFKGESAHAAAAPWRGRSALDAVELMDVGWNFRREHLRIQQRSHYVIPNGGDQPNVVPPNASVWYYFRETDYPHIKELWELGDNMAKGAALMTNTTWTSQVLGSAWPSHMNKTVAETMHANIDAVGLPEWTDADQTLAHALQHELKVPEIGLATKIQPLRGRESIPDEEKRGGGSDDIGDISWTVPTVTLGYPANMQAGPGHNWANAISMATPIAHKGVTYGAKVQAMTVLDLLTRAELVTQAWEYFNNVQTKNGKYTPLIRPEDKPTSCLTGRARARSLGPRSHVRRERAGRALRAGLGGCPRPSLSVRAVAAAGDGDGGRGSRAQGAEARPRRAAPHVPRRSQGRDELVPPARRRDHHVVRPRRECRDRGGPEESLRAADRVQGARHHAGAVDAGDRHLPAQRAPGQH